MEQLTRNEAIRRLREHLLPLADEKTSLCKAVSEHGVFCRGFSRWDDEELRRRCPTSVGATRADTEQRLNERQLERQSVSEGKLPCDGPFESSGDRLCMGFDDFYEPELAEYLGELTGEAVRVRD